MLFGIGAIAIVWLEDTTDSLGLSGRDFWWLALILGFLAGVIVGGVEALIVTYSRIPVLWSSLLGVFFGLALAYIFAFANDSALDANHRRFLELFAVWQILYPGIICFVFNRLTLVE